MLFLVSPHHSLKVDRRVDFHKCSRIIITLGGVIVSESIHVKMVYKAKLNVYVTSSTAGLE